MKSCKVKDLEEELLGGGRGSLNIATPLALFNKN